MNWNRSAAIGFFALIIMSFSTISEANYTFGRLKSEVGGVLATDPEDCSGDTPDNIGMEIKWRGCSTCSPTYSWRWGQDVIDSVVQTGMPIEFEDEGNNDCMQATGNLWITFRRTDGTEFVVPTYVPDGYTFFSNKYYTYDDNIEGTLRDGKVYWWKETGCNNSHGEYHSEAGTGGYGGWYWIANVHYLKSGS